MLGTVSDSGAPVGLGPKGHKGGASREMGTHKVASPSQLEAVAVFSSHTRGSVTHPGPSSSSPCKPVWKEDPSKEGRAELAPLIGAPGLMILDLSEAWS